ncbi:MAG: AAA family ATPase, partial [Pseudomonadota bacterium]
FKIKKAVDLGYLNFSTLAKRQAACRAEIDLNKPNAPEIYHHVAPVTRNASGQISIGHSEKTEEEIVDYVICMSRFDQHGLFSQLAKNNSLSPDVLVQTAHMISTMHARATPSFDDRAVTRLLAIADDISITLKRSGSRLDQRLITTFQSAVKTSLRKHQSQMISRLQQGWVRRCHGDLHLRNLVLVNDTPVAFDALEFDEILATIDVLYDIAFLLMDLVSANQRAGANLVLNTYLQASAEPRHINDIALIPLFMAMRAGIRAMVAANQFQEQSDHPPSALSSANHYIELAEDLLKPDTAALYAIGGPSGTGKSTLARMIAPKLGRRMGAVHLRSDVVRKELAGAALTDRLPSDHYTPEASKIVYEKLLEQAEITLTAGLPVIVDAVFGDPNTRDALADLANRIGVPMKSAWLSGPVETLKTRVTARQGDASDATAAVVERQIKTLEPPTDWPHINAMGPLDETATKVCTEFGIET